MASIIRLVGPVDPEAARWAASLNDPATGRLAVIVPPGLPSFERLAEVLLGALGKPATANPRGFIPTDRTELLRAWLLAHRIDRLILVHADWLDAPLRDEVAAFAALVGLELVVTVPTPDWGDEPYAAWSGEDIGWADFVAHETRDEPTRRALAADPTRSQGERIPVLGVPAGTHPVAAASKGMTRIERVTYLDVAGRLRRDGRTEAVVANALMLALREVPPAERAEAVAGAAAALKDAGWDLRGDTVEAMPSWGALRESVFPHLGASVALMAAGLWPEEAACARAADVAADGSWVMHDCRKVAIPTGARPFVVAQQRLTDDPTAPFLSQRGKPMSAKAAATTVSAALAGAGYPIASERLVRPRKASLRWLAKQGFVLRRSPAAVASIRKDKRCGHGLPCELIVEGIALTHSQRLCLAPGPAESRPSEVRPAAAGYVLEELERTRLGRRVGVARPDGDGGELIGVDREGDLVWLQVGVGRAPSLEAISRAVAELTTP